MAMSVQDRAAAVDSTSKFADLRAKSLYLERAIEQMLNLHQREWLGHIVISAGLHRGDCVFDRSECSHQDYERVRIMLLDLFQQLETIHLGHLVVGEHQVEITLTRKNRERTRSTFRRRYLVPTRFKELGQARPDVLFVIDYEQLRHVCTSSTEGASGVP